MIRAEEVGRGARIQTPFGERLLCYADLTATGRHLGLVERWVGRLLPYYANTHTVVSTTGALMTRLREDARQIVADAVNAGPEDVVVFCGSGATAAVNKLVGVLGLRVDEPLVRAHGYGRELAPRDRPVVFVGPYEHHSNELPWRETVADIVSVELDEAGAVDLADLERLLVAHADRPLKIGAFSAASNVTGLVTDVHAVARTLHRHGALAVFDYAAAGPYVPIDMHPGDMHPGDMHPGEADLDAIFLSTHKFMAGPGASGLLVAHARLFRSRVPERPGGGTVDYVSAGARAVDYTARLHDREEGGTPAILGDLRAGAAFLVKGLFDPDALLAHELAIAEAALERLGRHPRVRLLGSTTLPRLPIVSFNLEGLHHDLVSILLDHLFGIQNRSGCACAGPYGHRLLGIGAATSERFRALIARGVVGMKPGWVRLSLPYYASAADLDFILSAVEFVADHGDAFVPAYRLGWRDGVWRHADAPASPVEPPIALTVEALLAEVAPCAAADAREGERHLDEASLATERASYFARAHAEVARLEDDATAAPRRPPTGDPEIDALVWFDFVEAGA